MSIDTFATSVEKDLPSQQRARLLLTFLWPCSNSWKPLQWAPPCCCRSLHSWSSSLAPWLLPGLPSWRRTGSVTTPSTWLAGGAEQGGKDRFFSVEILLIKVLIPGQKHLWRPHNGCDWRPDPYPHRSPLPLWRLHHGFLLPRWHDRHRLALVFAPPEVILRQRLQQSLLRNNIDLIPPPPGEPRQKGPLFAPRALPLHLLPHLRDFHLRLLWVTEHHPPGLLVLICSCAHICSANISHIYQYFHEQSFR